MGLAWGIAIGALVTAALPFVLIGSQWPRGPQAGVSGGLSFEGVMARGTPEDTPEPRPVRMRDGFELQVRAYLNQPGGPLVVMVHGSGWAGVQFAHLAPTLPAHVLVPDLRGHGAAPGRRGDLDHIGQFEEDLADLINAHRAPGQKVVLLGHSSGGGLALRFAGGAYGDLIDAAILLAPFLQYDAPTTRANSGGWARPLTRRLIGLSMLNAVGIRALNGLTVIEFNHPEAVRSGPLGHLATSAYSYRLNTSYAPRRAYLDEIAALPPFLLVAGQADEAFDASAYAPLMQQATDKGRYEVLPGVGHLDVVDDAATRAAIEEFLGGF